MSASRRIALASGLLVLSLLTACEQVHLDEARIAETPLGWADLEGWMDDALAESWPALLRNCERVRERPAWEAICEAAERLSPAPPDDATARAFYEQWFRPHRVESAGWFWERNDGLVTGYYEPLLQGSEQPTPRYRYPLYAAPDDLLTIDLGALYPELEGKRVRGRLDGKRVVPFHSREEIERERAHLAGHELLWVDDRFDAFFLQIQGSGRVRLEDGRVVRVGYADQNGHPYRAIGRDLISRGEVPREEMSLFAIRDWLRAHESEADALLNLNPSYVFFRRLEDIDEHTGPIGSLGVPLTPERSIAVDRTVVPLGSPVWLDTNRPGQPQEPYRRLTFAQDTGGAIRGAQRADVFWGWGDEAERAAGVMKERGRMIVLRPVHEAAPPPPS